MGRGIEEGGLRGRRGEVGIVMGGIMKRLSF